MLNLFLALLLSSFGASNLSAAGGADEETNKLSEAFNRIGRLRRWLKKIIIRGLIYVKERIVECCRRQISARRGKDIITLEFLFSIFFTFFYALGRTVG